MKDRRIWAALVAALVFALPALAQDAARRAKDADKAFEEAQKLARKDTCREALAKYREAALAYKDAGDARGRVKALAGVGRMLQYFAEQPDEALAAFTEALEIARAAHDRALEADALDALALGRKGLKDVEGSVHAYEESFAIRDSLEDWTGASAALYNIVATYYAAKDEAHAADARARDAAYRKQHGVPATMQRVSGGVLAGKALRKVQPSYPEEAKAVDAQGAVVVEVMVSTKGTVESARVVSGLPELRDAALEAAKHWTFSPTVLNGEPVRIVGTITFNFRRT